MAELKFVCMKEQLEEKFKRTTGAGRTNINVPYDITPTQSLTRSRMFLFSGLLCTRTARI